MIEGILVVIAILLYRIMRLAETAAESIKTLEYRMMELESSVARLITDTSSMDGHLQDISTSTDRIKDVAWDYRIPATSSIDDDF